MASLLQKILTGLVVGLQLCGWHIYVSQLAASIAAMAEGVTAQNIRQLCFNSSSHGHNFAAGSI